MDEYFNNHGRVYFHKTIFVDQYNWWISQLVG